jgi:hypothetical protein
MWSIQRPVLLGLTLGSLNLCLRTSDECPVPHLRLLNSLSFPTMFLVFGTLHCVTTYHSALWVSICFQVLANT